jgi:hypothetical protein
MKSRLYLTIFILLVGVLLLPLQQVMAQAPTLNDTVSYAVGDTMYVACYHSDWSIRINALRNTIMSDTAGGTRANLNRIYKLKTNGIYYEADDIPADFPLTIVADPMSSVIAPNAPPLLQIATDRGDGSGTANLLITASDDCTLRNIFVSGALNTTGAQNTDYQPLKFAGNNKRYLVDGCVFQNANFALVVVTGPNNVLTVTNNKFRNLEEHPVTQQYTGRGISVWADQDSVIIENNTFFNLGFTTFQVEGGSAAYLRYNHNTVVGTGRGIMSNSGDWWRNAYFANNLLINAWWQGERYADTHVSGRDPREAHNGFFIVNDLPASYGPQQSRRIVITNNAAYLDPLIKAKYGTGGVDSIVSVHFTDPVSKLDFLTPYSVAGGDGHMYVGDTTWLTTLPTGFVNYLEDADWLKPKYSATGATMVDSMWSLITDIYNGVTGGTEVFYHPEASWTDWTWPLPEDCSYSTGASIATMGSDGLPLGDLNYFPTQKATFEAGKANFVSQIEQKAGAITVDSVKDVIEAETGSLGGNSAIQTIPGKKYYKYSNSGTLTWTFTVPAGKAGIYSTSWNVNLAGAGGSQGMVLHMNDIQINDKALGWGAMPFSVDPEGTPQVPESGLPANDWTWVRLDTSNAVTVAAFTTTEGTNTIGVKGGGWNSLNFSEVDLAPSGSATNDTIKLTAVDAVPVFATAGAEGQPWVASLFKYVNLGTSGTVTFDANASVAGTYVFRIFGQNLSGSEQTITMREGSTTIVTPALPYKTKNGGADSSGNDVLSRTFALTAGVHTFELSGGNVNIDYIQLLKEDVINGVNGQNLLPNSFALEQNYPNPFNPSTTINFTLGKASNVKLTVYNLLGQRVATLVDGRMNAGTQSVVFDASRFASGVYFYRLDAGSNFNSVKKMLLLK